MGRPLNKKYFGNRNIGTTGSSDNNIGGQGVATVTITTEGTYTSALPTATFSTPDLPGGVRATGVVHGHALSAVATAAGTGYNLGDTLTPTSVGTTVVPATFTVTALTVVGITLKSGGTANDVGDEFVYNNANFAVAMRVRVTAATGGVATAVALVDGGRFVNGTLPGATDAGGFTRVQVVAGQDMNGQGLEVNFTAWGVSTVQVANQGNFTSISGGAKATTSTNGSGATLTVTYGVSGVEPSEKGSGYTSAADAAVTFSAGTAAGTSVLTTDSGATNNNDNAGTNQENAIVVSAQTTSGGSDKIGDIVSQKGARRFKVKTADGTAVCTLAASSNLTAGQMSIIATDARGNTYYVTKLTAKKATLTRKTQNGGNAWVHIDGGVAQWSFAGAVGAVVQVANA